jgi:DNA-binding transcriptional ArsR family regulator
MASWSFLTNHALVLIHVGRRPDSIGLEIAEAIGVTERAVRKILSELQSAGYIEAERSGRRNRYRVDVHRPAQRVGDRDLTVGELLAIAPDGQEPYAEAARSAERLALDAARARFDS